MILLSAVLVLVALVLLLYGVIASDGVFEIWLSIAASVAAGLLLVWGILQQRRRLAASAPATTDAATAVDTASTPDAAATTDTTVLPPAEETAQERVAAHDSAPVVAVEPEPEPVQPAAVEPPADVEEPREIDGTGRTAETVTPSQPLGTSEVGAPLDVSPDSTAPTKVAAPDDRAASHPLSVDASHVLVLAGRPRYHVPGCRFLDGRDDIEVMRLDDAQAQGYTPCSVCRA